MIRVHKIINVWTFVYMNMSEWFERLSNVPAILLFIILFEPVFRNDKLSFVSHHNIDCVIERVKYIR